MHRSWRSIVPLLLAVAAALPGCGDDEGEAADRLRVFAASSLREVLPAYERDATYSFAGSNVLQLQIERGGPADVFASASPDEPAALAAAGRCGPPVAFATNRLVLLVPRGSDRVTDVRDLRRGGLRLAVAGEDVPVGKATRKLLAALGLAEALEANTTSTESNVGNVVSKVALGSADAGFAYVTDATIAADRTRSVALPAGAQPPVRYTACVVRRDGTDEAGAQRYLEGLIGPAGREVLRKAGFGLPR